MASTARYIRCERERERQKGRKQEREAMHLGHHKTKPLASK